MYNFVEIARTALSYEDEQLKVHQKRKAHILSEIALMKHWEDWLESFILFLKNHGVVKEFPDRFVISMHKLRVALVREPYIKDRPFANSNYLRLRRLACDCQFARFTKFANGNSAIEVAKPNLELLKSFLPAQSQVIDLPKGDTTPNPKTTLEYKIGQIVKGVDTQGGDPNYSYIWRACPICGKQEWAKIGRTGKPIPKRCSDCMLFKRRGSPTSPKLKRGSGYIFVRLEPTDFFYPMAGKGGYILEHRLVMAKHLGRHLQPWENVHHKNGIKNDNRLENLELVASVGEHIANHNTGYIGGYKHGRYDGTNKTIKELKTRIAELEAQVKT